jgi:hypothetical protein
MRRNTPLHADHQLDQLAGQFEHWRHTRTHPRDRIPQALWEQAVALARVIPHSRVAQHLRLSANDLKKQRKRNKKVAVHPCRALTRFFALFHEVRLMRKPHNPCHVKRRSWEHTEP